MPSPSKTLRLPPDLADAVQIRAQALGFRSWTDYAKSLMRYDLLVQGDHAASKPWADLPLVEQDKIDAWLLELTKQGKGQRGQMLKHLLQQVQGDVSKLGEEMRGERLVASDKWLAA